MYIFFPIGLQEFKTEKYKGRYLNVTVARENFLDKLKREREEAASKTTTTELSEKTEPQLLNARTPPVRLPALARKVESSSGSDDSSDESDDEPSSAKIPAVVAKTTRIDYPTSEIDADGDLLLRKRSKAFLENGKVGEKL